MLAKLFGRGLAMVVVLAFSPILPSPVSAAVPATFFLRDRQTGFYLDSNIDKQVYTHDYNGGAYQKWQFYPTEDGYWFIRDLATGFYLDSNADKQVYTHDYNGGAFQQWKLIPSGNGYFFLRNKATGFYLDSNADKQVYTHDYNGGAFQQWFLFATRP
jgi:hypothetical protein